MAIAVASIASRSIAARLRSRFPKLDLNSGVMGPAVEKVDGVKDM